MNIEERPEIVAIREHGATALAHLFQELRPKLERIVSFRLDPRLQGRLDPADILQEAFIEISRRVSGYLESPTVSLLVWMRQMTVQTLIDIQRTEFREKRDVNREIRFASQEGDETSISIARVLAAGVMSPSRMAINEEERLQVQTALSQMNETDREVLALRHFEQLSNQEVAEILKLTPTAASNRYVRALSRLSEILKSIESGSKER